MFGPFDFIWFHLCSNFICQQNLSPDHPDNPVPPPQQNRNVNVDIYEKAPVPFGLIRFGVAPDHPEVKNVIASFNKIALNERVTFNGNINIGKQVTLDQLRHAYNVVVLCYGSTEDRTLNIDGEQLPCVLPAKRFVGWYNGVEEDRNLEFNLDVENVVIIGQGNVALDCARILLEDVDTHLKVLADIFVRLLDFTLVSFIGESLTFEIPAKYSFPL